MGIILSHWQQLGWGWSCGCYHPASGKATALCSSSHPPTTPLDPRWMSPNHPVLWENPQPMSCGNLICHVCLLHTAVATAIWLGYATQLSGLTERYRIRLIKNQNPKGNWAMQVSWSSFTIGASWEKNIGHRYVWSLKQKTSISSRLSLKSIDWSTALQCFPVLLHLPFLPIPSVVQELHGLIPGQLISLWRNVLEIKAGTCELDCSKNDSSCKYITNIYYIYSSTHARIYYIATYVYIYIYIIALYIYIYRVYIIHI